MTFRRRQCLGLLGVAALMPAVVIPADGESERAAERVFETINARLSWMDDVARYKRVNAIPVEDLEREVIVIDKAIAGQVGCLTCQKFSANSDQIRSNIFDKIRNWHFGTFKLPLSQTTILDGFGRCNLGDEKLLN